MMRETIKASFVLVFALVLLVLSCARDKTPLGPAEGPAVCPQQDIPWPSLANSPWPMYRHDPQLTGRSPYTGPRRGRIRWTFTTEPLGLIYPGIVIGPDGTIYFMSNCENFPGGQRGALYAVSPDGELRWRYYFEEAWPADTPIVLADGGILVTSLRPCIINPDGTLRKQWSALAWSPINIGADGTLYFVDPEGYLCAMTQAGCVVWRLLADGGFTREGVTVSPSGDMLYAFTNVTLRSREKQSLCAVGLDGTVRWKFELGESRETYSAPVVDAQGSAIFCALGPDSAPDRGVTLVSREGRLVWRYQVSGAGEEAAIGRQGDFFLECDLEATRALVCLDCLGRPRWAYPLGRYQSKAAPICDREGVTYLCRGEEVIAVGPAGTPLWSVPLEAGITRIAGPAIGSDGTLYVGTVPGQGGPASGRIYAIE
ncbi:MAG: PQQ-like beta-propeller repeat protein [Calditrichaeota bacterium]|nr:PQQ-like beta-propeller repeat protein [Calditrichota bacterium]